MTARVVNRNENDLAVFALAINELAAGRSNATGTFTLTANAASTTVSNQNFAEGSVPIPMPTTSNAVAEYANGTMYISARANGSFTLVHANNAQTDRTFIYAILG